MSSPSPRTAVTAQSMRVSNGSAARPSPAAGGGSVTSQRDYNAVIADHTGSEPLRQSFGAHGIPAAQPAGGEDPRPSVITSNSEEGVVLRGVTPAAGDGDALGEQTGPTPASVDVETCILIAVGLLSCVLAARLSGLVQGQSWVPTNLLSVACDPSPCTGDTHTCMSTPPVTWDGRAWLDPSLLLPCASRAVFSTSYAAMSLIYYGASIALATCSLLCFGTSFLTGQADRVRAARALALLLFMAAMAVAMGATHSVGNADIIVYSGDGYVFASAVTLIRWAFFQPCMKAIVNATLASALAGSTSVDSSPAPGSDVSLQVKRLLRVNVSEVAVMIIAIIIIAYNRTTHSPYGHFISGGMFALSIGLWASQFLSFWLQKHHASVPPFEVPTAPPAHDAQAEFNQVLLGRQQMTSLTQLPSTLVSSRALTFMRALESMNAGMLTSMIGLEMMYECGMLPSLSPLLHAGVCVLEVLTYTCLPMINVFYVVLASDERSLLQEKLSLARAQAASELAASTSIRRYLRYTSHELRVPMQGIVLGLHTLARVIVDNPESRECVDMMTSACDSMQTIMNSVLTLSAIEAGKFTLSYSTSSMRRLVHNAMQSLRPWASEANINLTSHVSPDVPSLMRMDAQRLQQVCANLLSNAIKFVPHDGSGCVSLTVSVLPHATGPAHTCAPTSPCVVVRVAVCDNGVGISEEEQRKLFTAFHQIGSHVKSYASTGLGLAIAHEIVRLHGGVIHCTSSGVAGAGSMFAMDIPFMVCEGSDEAAVVTETPVPVATHVPATTAAVTATATTIDGASGVQAETTEARHDSAANGAAQPAAQSATTPSAGIAAEPGVPATQPETRMHAAAEVAPSTASSAATSAAEVNTPSLRFLVVDDSKLNRRMLATMCSRLYKKSLVQEACDGAQAVEMVTAQQAAHSRSHPYDVICMDRDMPRMSGDDATRAIRAQGCVCAMVGVTGNALEEDTRVFMEAGLNSVLIKPIAPDALRSTLDAALAASSRDSDALHAMTGE